MFHFKIRIMNWKLYIVALFLFSSCGKYLEDYSQDLVIPKSVQDFDELLLGNAYLPRHEVSKLNSGGLGWFLQILDDDSNTALEPFAFNGVFEMDGSYFGYYAWQFEVGRSFDGLKVSADNGTWDNLYQRINSLNIILSEIDNMPQEIQKDRESASRIKGEALFLRAQFYLTLVNLYADAFAPSSADSKLGVPLKLTEFVEHDKNKETQFERATVSQVYQQIVADLEQSINSFEQTSQIKPIYRASNEAAMLLLSRVYLYMQNWESAADWAKKVLAKSNVLYNYASIGSTSYVISADNPEVLFAQGPLNIQNAFTARGGDFCVTDELYSSYADDDYRKDIFFTRSTFSDSIAVSRKFRKELHVSEVSDLFLLRTSEVHLNLIESLAMMGQLNEAKELLDNFRSFRMSSIPVITVDQPTLIEEVRSERRKELCFEGHRWFDLRRYAALEQFSYKKDIVHVYNSYNWNDRNIAVKAVVYKLNQDDLAYTFAIPKSVLEFDRGMPNNPREVRKPILEIPFIN